MCNKYTYGTNMFKFGCVAELISENEWQNYFADTLLAVIR